MTDITPATCRAGRGLVDLTQAELAEAAGVSLTTVRAFEARRSIPVPRNLAAIEAALDRAGVIFLAEAGEVVGVRLSKEAMADGSTTTPPGTGTA